MKSQMPKNRSRQIVNRRLSPFSMFDIEVD